MDNKWIPISERLPEVDKYGEANVMDFMNYEGWKKRLVDGEFKHYCPECQKLRLLDLYKELVNEIFGEDEGK